MSDALIVGGGPAGAALGVLLARAGARAIVVEREDGPADKLCGEFLSQEALHYAESLGIDLLALGAVPLEGVRLIADARSAETRLPFRALGLSRRIFDEALLHRAAAAGASVLRGSAVHELVPEHDAWTARLACGARVSGRAAFLATGKHDLRGFRRPPGVQSDLLAFKLHFRLAPDQAADLGSWVELVLFRDGYAGLQRVEEGKVNLCLLVRRRRFAPLAAWEILLQSLRDESSHLDRRLRGASPCASRPLTVGTIPYGYVRKTSEGVYRLGDQAAVIPSFSGDGISIALHSAHLAARAFCAGIGAESYQRALAEDVGRQVRLATALSLALVRGPAQRVVSSVTPLLPRLLTSVARRTRVAEGAVERLAS